MALIKYTSCSNYSYWLITTIFAIKCAVRLIIIECGVVYNEINIIEGNQAAQHKWPAYVYVHHNDGVIIQITNYEK